MDNKEQSEKKADKKNFIIKRIGGHLHKVIPILDSKGKFVQNVLLPFPVEFKLRDLLQVIAGASILMVPVAFTEEVWVLSEQLPMKNIMTLVFISLFIISIFVYYNFYSAGLKGHVIDYMKRVFITYGASLMIVAIFLSIINKCPWSADNFLAIKRIILVGFPASMSGTISDAMK